MVLLEMGRQVSKSVMARRNAGLAKIMLRSLSVWLMQCLCPCLIDLKCVSSLVVSPPESYISQPVISSYLKVWRCLCGTRIAQLKTSMYNFL